MPPRKKVTKATRKGKKKAADPEVEVIDKQVEDEVGMQVEDEGGKQVGDPESEQVGGPENEKVEDSDNEQVVGVSKGTDPDMDSL